MEIYSSFDDENDYYQGHFVRLKLTRETIYSKEFEACRFEECSFMECEFDGCKFVDCEFHNCLLSATVLTNCDLSEVSFFECKIIGIDWAKAGNLRMLAFTKCTLNYSMFTNLKLKKIKMLACECKDCDFSEADLTKGEFEKTDFEKSVFSRTNLTEASFRGARHYAIDPRDNVIKHAKFSLPEAGIMLECLGIILVDPESD